MSRVLELAERARDAASGDEVEAVVHSERSGFARFASSEIHQPTLIEDEAVSLRVVRDGRIGSATGNRLDAEGLRALAARAEESADAAPQDPDFAGLPSRASLPDVAGYDDESAALGPDDQARLAGGAISAARDFDLYGFFTSGESTVAIATTTGIASEQTMTDATVLTLAAVDGASGYAERSAWRAADLDPAAVAREAVEKAARTRGAKTVEPKSYRAVLEPYAVAELLQNFAYDSFSGLALLEERSFLCGRLGERAFDEKVSIVDDPLDPAGYPKSFDFEGTPKQRVPLVEAGVLSGVVWDMPSAARSGGKHVSTGHAPPGSMRQWGPLPLALRIAGGEADSTEELAELVDDGIYVTRLHYLSVVDPREGVITGMTRDGTFRIRGGKVAEPTVNLRFTVSVPELLRDVPGLTRNTLLVNQSAFYDERYPYGARVPALATAEFAITGVGSEPGV